MNKPDIYVSVDVETDGLFPGVNSMLSVGAVVFKRPSCNPVAQFTRNLLPLIGACPNANTMQFWAEHPEAWAEVRKNRVAPIRAIKDFQLWTAALGGCPVYVCWPGAFDFNFTHYYFLRYIGHDPYGHSPLDIGTMLWSQLGYEEGFRAISKKAMPPALLKGAPDGTHVALTDALQQGMIFANAMGWK